MTKWEYEEGKAHGYRMAKMGLEGWELVTMYEYEGTMYAMYKRPIEGEK